ncbi:hypothetical protein G7Y89_g10122 [Cudoniella acicularis]|uniref:non-specific serine/threonine protein kinase n=1 Tax=Cudoniella acicularis TaxID=354080 RepID=A0A8H4VZI2_9HELO|nr:hypothetical protein G7Y89_g10122 [Cudoniella acicularis]
MFRSKPKWENPQLSMGQHYCNIPVRLDRRPYLCWEAIGPAQALWRDVLQTEVDQCLNKSGQIFPKPVGKSMYMIGRNEKGARPIIIFCGEKHWREVAMKTVQDSGLLDKYPGVITGARDLPPEAGNDFQELPTDQGVEWSPHEVLYVPSERSCGVQIFVQAKGGIQQPEVHLRKATGGGIIRCGEKYYYLTAAHAFGDKTTFKGYARLQQQTLSCDGDFKFGVEVDYDTDREEEDIDDDECLMEMVSEGSATSTSGESDTTTSLELSSPDTLQLTSPLHPRPGDVQLGSQQDSNESVNRLSAQFEETGQATSPSGSSEKKLHYKVLGDRSTFTGTTDLDFALIHIETPHPFTFNEIQWQVGSKTKIIHPESIAQEPKNANIIAVTGSAGVLEGHLSGTPSFWNDPHSLASRQFWTVRLAGRLSNGDCGSWVIDAETGDLYGHIVAGSPSNGVAYIMPTCQIQDYFENSAEYWTFELPTRLNSALTLKELYSTEATQSPGALEGNEQSSSTEWTGVPGPQPKGTLTVKITEARGLQKSRDPYVVAVFQKSELVSKSHLSEDGNENEEIPVIQSRSESASGRPMAIPMKNRQSNSTSQFDYRDFKIQGRKPTANPKWNAEAVFDVVGSDPRINITIYDRISTSGETLGHIDLEANLSENNTSPINAWFPLRGRNNSDTGTGEIYLIGKGTLGQVYQVKKKDTNRIYAMKVIQKKVIVQKKQVANAVTERNILVRTTITDSPFIVGLKFSFQTPTDLYLITNFMSGGDLFWHLQKEGKFDDKRAKFYIAELILALQHLHDHNIIYRDLKPENILLDANGHIGLCDFGLSKANLAKNATTKSFCGTTEYMAPETLLDEAGYTNLVDFWSLGVLIFEMCCGWSPFYAEDTQQMYKNIAFGKVRFPRDCLGIEGRNLVKGLLNRNPKHRLGATEGAEELKKHPFFADIDWEALAKKLVTPPFKPQLKPEIDTSNFDPEFTNASLNETSSLSARARALAAGSATTPPLSPGLQANFKGFTFVDESLMDEHMQTRIKDEYSDMDEDEEREQDLRHKFDINDKPHSDGMSDIVMTGTNEDSNTFTSGHFDI